MGPKSILMFIAVGIIGAFLFYFVKTQERTDRPDPKPVEEAHENDVGERAIANVDGQNIRFKDLKNYLTRRPFPRNAEITDEALKERLDEMIVVEVLYQEAMRLNVHQDPEIRREVQQIIVQKLLEERIDKKTMEKPIDENEGKAYYEKHRYEFEHPEQVRLADIFIAVSPDADKENRAERKKKADSALNEALKAKDNTFQFGELIRKYSDTHPKYSLGDTGYFDAEGRPLGLSEKMAEEAFRLKDFQVADHLIETSEGYHVIMLIGRQPAVRRSINDVQGEIRQRIRHEKLRNARQAFIKELKEKARIQMDDQMITELLSELRERRAKEPVPAAQKLSKRPGSKGAPPPVPGQEIDKAIQ